ncbi:MAG TPA: formylglycine-generating enzyme family protein [Anaerolineaceae bacterium]|nr:formylglycine-generating enzyme family protein [Anaerolineaceae bacterium]
MNEEIFIDPPAGITCQSCNHLNALEVNYCEMCGNKLFSIEAPQPVQPQKGTPLSDESISGYKPEDQQISEHKSDSLHQLLIRPQQQPICPKCGRLKAPGSQLCINCGYRFSSSPEESVKKIDNGQPESKGIQVEPIGNKVLTNSKKVGWVGLLQQRDKLALIGLIGGIFIIVAAISVIPVIFSDEWNASSFPIYQTKAAKTEIAIAVLATNDAYYKMPTISGTITPSVSISTPPNCSNVGQSWISPQDGAKLMCVPVGEFEMGGGPGETDSDNDEKPLHTVFLDAFWIDEKEVTNAMFAKFVAETNYFTDAEKFGRGEIWISTENKWIWSDDANWMHPYGPGSSIADLQDYPVVQVSWNDAHAYCQWVGRNLPSEAQWEKAARGTDGRVFPWGDNQPTGIHANFADKNFGAGWATRNLDDNYQFSAPVGSYPKGQSPYGVLDMAGNVYEWVADFFLYEYYSSQVIWNNPTGPETGNNRSIRGGSWDSLPSWNLRVADRHGREATYHGANYGFRCGYTP